MLSEKDVEQYARQIVVPGVGVLGQERICACRVRVVGEPAGVSSVEAYALATGFKIATNADVPPACILVAGTHGLLPAVVQQIVNARCAILWYALTPEGVRAGRIAPGADAGDLRRHTSSPPGDPLVHRLAAADLVASAIGLVLGWTDVETSYDLEVA